MKVILKSRNVTGVIRSVVAMLCISISDYGERRFHKTQNRYNLVTKVFMAVNNK